MRGRRAGDAAPLVVLHVSGGVAGIREELRVLTSGQAVLVRLRAGRRRPSVARGELAPGERATIERLVAVADVDAATARGRRVYPAWVHGADALSYSLTIGERTVPTGDSPTTIAAVPPIPERGAGKRPTPWVPPTDPDPDPLRSLRSALLDVRRRLSS